MPSAGQVAARLKACRMARASFLGADAMLIWGLLCAATRR